MLKSIVEFQSKLTSFDMHIHIEVFWGRSGAPTLVRSVPQSVDSCVRKVLNIRKGLMYFLALNVHQVLGWPSWLFLYICLHTGIHPATFERTIISFQAEQYISDLRCTWFSLCLLLPKKSMTRCWANLIGCDERLFVQATGIVVFLIHLLLLFFVDLQIVRWWIKLQWGPLCSCQDLATEFMTSSFCTFIFYVYKTLQYYLNIGVLLVIIKTCSRVTGVWIVESSNLADGSCHPSCEQQHAQTAKCRLSSSVWQPISVCLCVRGWGDPLNGRAVKGGQACLSASARDEPPKKKLCNFLSDSLNHNTWLLSPTRLINNWWNNV